MRNVVIAACALVSSLIFTVSRLDLILRANYHNVPSAQILPGNGDHHVVFSQYKCRVKKCSHVAKIVEENSRMQWNSMSSPDATITFLDLTNATKTNKFGAPILRDMYLKAQELHPNATTYTYMNGDLLPRLDFLATLNAVTLSQQHIWNHTTTTGFMIVGRRMDVDWKKHHKTLVNSSKFRFDKHRGNLHPGDAQDYFVVSRNAIDWTTIPDFVIGRIGYDNWLVDYVYHKQGVHLVDATKTIHVIHQSDEEGSQSQGGGLVKQNDEDFWWNHAIASPEIFENKQWADHGLIDEAVWFSTYSGDGSVVIRQRAPKNRHIIQPRRRPRLIWKYGLPLLCYFSLVTLLRRCARARGWYE